jgi:alpha-L-arabinofuranosidase
MCIVYKRKKMSKRLKTSENCLVENEDEIVRPWSKCDCDWASLQAASSTTEKYYGLMLENAELNDAAFEDTATVEEKKQAKDDLKQSLDLDATKWQWRDMSVMSLSEKQQYAHELLFGNLAHHIAPSMAARNWPFCAEIQCHVYI